MTGDQWIEALVILLGTGSIGGLIAGAVIEAWKERRAAKRKEKEVELQKKQAEEAGQRAADDFLKTQGQKRFDDLEKRLGDSEKRADDAEKRADEAEKRADAIEAKQRERDDELTQMRSTVSDAVARAERETKARVQAEEATRAVAGERDTVALENERLKRYIDDTAKAQQERDRANDEKFAAMQQEIDDIKRDRDERQRLYEERIAEEQKRREQAEQQREQAEKERDEMRQNMQRDIDRQAGEIKTLKDKIAGLETAAGNGHSPPEKPADG